VGRDHSAGKRLDRREEALGGRNELLRLAKLERLCGIVAGLSSSLRSLRCLRQFCIAATK
jgi:hypothetical protein